MLFRDISLRAIPEAIYLNTENAWRYRAIMRTFYLESQKANIRLNKPQLLSLLRTDARFAEYTADQLEQDLNFLCERRNLVAIQDPHRPTSIAEYKNKQFSYSMSQAATEIERMTLALEELDLRTAGFTPQLYDRILDDIEQMSSLSGQDGKALNEWWELLQRDFFQLSSRYQDYLRDFHSSHAEHLLQTAEFLLYKDKVVQYLREFVLELQRHAEKTRKMLISLSPQTIDTLLEQVYDARLKEANGLLIERREGYAAAMRDQIYGFWNSFYHWFVPDASGQSDSQHVMEVANEIIQRILMNAELIIQAHSGGANRKGEYKKFLELFAACPSTEDAHRLAGLVFGAQRAVHFSGIQPEGLYETSSCYDVQPFLYTLRNRQRPGRPPREKSFFRDKGLEKAVQREAYLRQKARQRAQLDRYIQKGLLDLAAIDEEISPEIRQCFLRWIVKANANESKRARTEYGQSYTLSCPVGKTCVLHCTDGDLTMPAYCLEFDGGAANG